MIKAILMIVMLSAGVALVGQRAECVWCPTIRCFNSVVCGQCICMVRDFTPGVCVAFR